MNTKMSSSTHKLQKSNAADVSEFTVRDNFFLHFVVIGTSKNVFLLKYNFKFNQRFLTQTLVISLLSYC